MNAIDKALRDKMKKLIPVQAFVGKVLKVDENEYTCNVMPIDSDAQMFDVRLKPTIDTNKKGILAIPANDSFVIVGLLNSNDNSAFIIWCSNIKKYYIIGDNGNTLEFKDAGSILINGDNFEGLVKVAKNVERFNKIEQDINSLKQLFSGWVTVPSDGGAALKAITATWCGQMLAETQQSDIENTKVKHGG